MHNKSPKYLNTRDYKANSKLALLHVDELVASHMFVDKVHLSASNDDYHHALNMIKTIIYGIISFCQLSERSNSSGKLLRNGTGAYEATKS